MWHNVNSVMGCKYFYFSHSILENVLRMCQGINPDLFSCDSEVHFTDFSVERPWETNSNRKNPFNFGHFSMQDHSTMDVWMPYSPQRVNHWQGPADKETNLEQQVRNRCCVRDMAYMGHCSSALHPPDAQTFWICSFMHKYEQTTSCEESHTGAGKDQDRCKVPFVAPQLPCVVSWGSTCYTWPTCGQFQTAEIAWADGETPLLQGTLMWIIICVNG